MRRYPQDVSDSNHNVNHNASGAFFAWIRKNLPISLQRQAVCGLSDDGGYAGSNRDSAYGLNIVVEPSTPVRGSQYGSCETSWTALTSNGEKE
jgi:hypothetical protein